MTDSTPRWLYRFDNYKRAFARLAKVVELANDRELSELEEEGLIQRFEYTWELAWKLLADLLEADGVTLDQKTPKTVLRAAATANFIQDVDDWMDALDARNLMSHTYDIEDFERIVLEIQETYFDLLQTLHDDVAKRVSKP